MQRGVEEVRHGSHPHALCAALVEGRGPTAAPRQCHLCRGAIDVVTDHQAKRCTVCPDFYLCVKCFEVEEAPFPTPQIVLRNPILSRCDDNVCVRTRPRGNAFSLCPIQSGELIEVVAYTNAKDGSVYFRQRAGGWIQANHVVCVYPSERSVAALASTHVSYHQTGIAPSMATEALLAYVHETIELLDDSPEFGLVMGFLTLLPLQLAVSDGARGWAEEDATNTVVVYVLSLLQCAVHALNDCLGQTPHLLLQDASLCFLVKMCGRLLSILWNAPAHLVYRASFPHHHEADSGARGCAQTVVNEAAEVLVRVLTITRSHCSASTHPTSIDNDRTTVRPTQHLPKEACCATESSRAELWSTVQVENASVAVKMLQARGIAWTLLEGIAQMVLDAPLHGFTVRIDGTVLPGGLRELKVMRTAITSAETFPEELGYLFCKSLVRAMCAADGDGQYQTLVALQVATLNLDAVEMVVRMLKVFRDERRVVAALHLLRWMCYRNHRIIQLVCTVVVAPLLHLLRTTSYESVVNAAFDACTALSFNLPIRAAASNGNIGGAMPDPPLPHCTAVAHRDATPFQCVNLFMFPDSGEVVALCSHCALEHRPVHLQAAEVVAQEAGFHIAAIADPQRNPGALPTYGYFSCQCEACALPMSGGTASEGATASAAAKLSGNASQEPAITGGPVPVIGLPAVPLTNAQKLLASGRILSIMTQRLRTHGSAVANAAGRLSMLLCCNEEVAVALLCAVVGAETMGAYPDAALAVAACQCFGQVRYLMSLYSNSAIAAYLRNPHHQHTAAATASTPQQADPSASQASDRTPTHRQLLGKHTGYTSSLERSGQSVAFGLTPSPSTRNTENVVEGAPQTSAASSFAVRLFGPLQPH